MRDQVFPITRAASKGMIAGGKFYFVESVGGDKYERVYFRLSPRSVYFSRLFPWITDSIGVPSGAIEMGISSDARMITEAEMRAVLTPNTALVLSAWGYAPVSERSEKTLTFQNRFDWTATNYENIAKVLESGSVARLVGEVYFSNHSFILTFVKLMSKRKVALRVDDISLNIGASPTLGVHLMSLSTNRVLQLSLRPTLKISTEFSFKF